MRICMVSTDYLPNPGGVAAHVDGLAQGLQALGHHVCILTLAHETHPEGEAVENGLRVTRVALSASGSGSRLSLAVDAVRRRLSARLPLRYWKLPESWFGLPFFRLHQAERFDVIHFHGLGRDAVISRWSGAAPKVFTNHTSMFIAAVERGEGHIAWGQIKHADWFVAPSEELSRLTVLVGARADRVTTIANGVDTDTFRPSDASAFRQQHGFAPNEIIVMTARRLVEKNGVRYLVQAAADFLGSSSHVRLVIAGDGPEREELEALARKTGPGAIHFLGNISRDQIPSLTNMCDIAVLPSLKEATSIAGLEAMACGKPIVGTDVGGIPEIVESNVTGLLVPAADPSSLGQAIARLCGDAGLRDSMGKAGRQRVEDGFSWEAVARKTLVAYESAIVAGRR